MSDASEMMKEHALRVGSTFPWHEVYAPDVEKTLAFYTEVFGYGTQKMEMSEGFEYYMLTKDGKGVAGVLSSTAMGEGIPPHWAVYMTVDDVDAKVAKAVELGSTVVVPAMDVPTVGRMALIADPQGAHIWLYKDSSS